MKPELTATTQKSRKRGRNGDIARQQNLKKSLHNQYPLTYYETALAVRVSSLAAQQGSLYVESGALYSAISQVQSGAVRFMVQLTSLLFNHLILSQVQSSNVDVLRWNDAAGDGVVRAVSVRAECRGDPSAEFRLLQHSFIIPQVPEALSGLFFL